MGRGMTTLNFVWHIPRSGYRWVTARAADDPNAKEQRFLAPLSKGPVRVRQPMRDEPALFRVFAETPLNEEAIAGFANAHGLLGGDHLRPIAVSEAGVEPCGEPFDAWEEEIAAMRETLAVWDAVQCGDEAYFKRRVRWSNDKVTFEIESGTRVLADASMLDWAYSLMLLRYDYLRTARWLVQDIINEHLTGKVATRLLWNEERARSQMAVVPTSLASALWTQFALAVDAEKGFRRCSVCGKCFDVVDRAPGRQRIYCSARCRTRAYRDRKSESENEA